MRFVLRLSALFLLFGMTSFLSQISIVCAMAAVLNMCRRYGAQDPIYGQPEYDTEFALRCIRWLLCALPFACVNKGAFIFLQSIGKPVSSTLLSLLREIVGGVGLVLLLPCFFGLNGILYFMAAAELMTFAAVLPVLRTTAVRLRRLQPQGL